MLSMPRIVRPDSSGIFRTEIGSPVDPALAGPLSETKNWQELLTGNYSRQGNQCVVFTSSALNHVNGQDARCPHRRGACATIAS